MSPSLPVIRKRPRRPWRARLVHAVRVAVVIGLLWAIPSPADRGAIESGEPPPLDVVQELVSDAVALDPRPGPHGLWSIEDADGNVIALLARTMPAAEEVVGYRGPTEALIAFDADLKITAVRLLQSRDTPEHVEAVVADEIFFEQFRGWTWGGPDATQQIDGVSGATLTSLALAEGVMKRIGGERPSLVFPEPLSPEEVKDWFENVDSVEHDGALTLIRDDQGRPIGRVVRSGLLADDVIGYQGPTELLLQFSEQDQLQRVRVRSSYDNEPYVDYVRVEAGFWALFENQSSAQLAALDPEQAGIEGVSGATMTSLAVADTLVATANRLRETRETRLGSSASSLGIRWTSADLATMVVVIAAAMFSRLRWFRHRFFRRAWLLTVVLVIGLWAGNLVSMALLAGWAAEGIAWKLAPGLATIAVVALLAPLGKRNSYCDHLCPHGAAQQLIRPARTARRNLHPPRWLTRCLAWVPGVTLVCGYLAVVFFPSLDLSSWEPFHAYLFRIAGPVALGLAVGSLLLAALIPMGYCRFGCPTGRLLDYLRRNSASDRITGADGIAVGLLLLAWSIRWG